MKNFFFLVCLLAFSFESYAQLDKSKGTSTPMKGFEIPAEEKTTPSAPSLLPPPGNLSLSKKSGGLLLSAPKTFNLTDGKEKNTFSMTTDNGLKTYIEEDFKPKAFEDNGMKNAHKKDQYLGDFKTSGKFVELYCRDHQYVDGDKVRIIVNGEVVHNSVTLGGGYSPILVKLKSGFNHIEFEALNQGTSGPNTAELRVFDENGIELAKKEWNLLTGAKASIIVVKQ